MIYGYGHAPPPGVKGGQEWVSSLKTVALNKQTRQTSQIDTWRQIFWGGEREREKQYIYIPIYILYTPRCTVYTVTSLKGFGFWRGGKQASKNVPFLKAKYIYLNMEYRNLAVWFLLGPKGVYAKLFRAKIARNKNTDGTGSSKMIETTRWKRTV